MRYCVTINQNLNQRVVSLLNFWCWKMLLCDYGFWGPKVWFKYGVVKRCKGGPLCGLCGVASKSACGNKKNVAISRLCLKVLFFNNCWDGSYYFQIKIRKKCEDKGVNFKHRKAKGKGAPFKWNFSDTRIDIFIN